MSPTTLEEPRTKRYRPLTSSVTLQARIPGSSRLTAAPHALPPCDGFTCGGLTCSASTASRPLRKERPSVDAGRLKQSRKASRAFTREVPSCASSGRSPRTTCAPFRLRSTAIRVSRGVSAIGLAILLGLGLARAGSLAAVPPSEIEIRSICFCFPTLRQRAPVPCSLFGFIVTDHYLLREQPGVYSMGCCPPRPKTRAFHDALVASADRMLIVGAFSSLNHRSPCFGAAGGPLQRATEPLTPLSRPSLDTGLT